MTFLQRETQEKLLSYWEIIIWQVCATFLIFPQLSSLVIKKYHLDLQFSAALFKCSFKIILITPEVTGKLLHAVGCQSIHSVSQASDMHITAYTHS